MQLLKFVPIKLTLFLAIGIMMGNFFNLGPYPPLIVVTVSLSILGVLMVKQRYTQAPIFGILVGLVTMGIGILSFSLSQPTAQSDHYSQQEYIEKHIWHVKVREILKSNLYSDRYVVSIINCDGNATSGKLLIQQRKDSNLIKYEVDDELIINDVVANINPPLNPHQFNYKNYLVDLGIYDQIKLLPNNHFIKESSSITIYGIAAAFRNHIILKLRQANFGTEELGIIQALLLGQRNDISSETYMNYKNAGAVHILAVSGLHIGILLVLLQYVLFPLERLRNGKTIKLVVIVALLWGFALVAGLSASIIRAVTMFSFVAYAMYLNRPTNTFNILALSMFFILLIFSPSLLFQVGFQMSYAAVFAIVWIYPLLQKFWKPKTWILLKGWQLLSVSLAAQLGVLPISLYYFHQFPGLFFVSNLLIIPFLGVILGLGILLILLATLNILPDFLAAFYNTIIYGMNSIIGWVASQEAFIFNNISFDKAQLLLSYFIIGSLVLALSKVSKKRIVVLLIGIIGFQLWSFYALCRTQNKEHFLVVHEFKNTLLLHQIGNHLNVITPNRSFNNKIVADYEVGEDIDQTTYQSLNDVYLLNQGKLFIMDSLAIYPPKDLKPKYLLLTHTPKINLDRLIDSIGPKTIIADGSNYKNAIDRWKRSCTQKKIPFHYTGEKGAYYLK